MDFGMIGTFGILTIGAVACVWIASKLLDDIYQKGYSHGAIAAQWEFVAHRGMGLEPLDCVEEV